MLSIWYMATSGQRYEVLSLARSNIDKIVYSLLRPGRKRQNANDYTFNAMPLASHSSSDMIDKAQFIQCELMCNFQGYRCGC